VPAKAVTRERSDPSEGIHSIDSEGIHSIDSEGIHSIDSEGFHLGSWVGFLQFVGGSSDPGHVSMLTEGDLDALALPRQTLGRRKLSHLGYNGKQY